MFKALIIASFVIFGSFSSANEINTETFFKNFDLTSIRISPDGKHFAATIESDGTKKLAILDINATKIKHIFNFSSDKKEIGSYGWLNNERIYASMVRKVGPLDQPRGSGFLFAGNINGKKVNQLLPSRSKSSTTTRDIERPYSILNFLPNEDKYILISQLDDNRHTYAYKMNVYNGAKKTVAKSPEPYGQLLADHSGNVRLAFSSNKDGSKQMIHMKRDAKAEWELFKEFDDKGVSINPFGFTADNKKLIYHDVSEGKKPGIYHLDLATSEDTFIHPVNGDADIRFNIYDFNYEAPEIIGFSRLPGYVETEFFDPKHPVAKIYRSLFNSFKGQVVNIVNTSRNAQLAVIRVWSDYNPGNHYLMNMKTNKVTPLFTTGPWIDRKQMAAMQPIKFEARDGLEIRGYLTKPMKPKGKKKPMILMVHGGPYGVSDNWGYNREVQFLAHHGFTVLQINYRGSGGRGSDFIYDHYRQMGKEMQYDLTDATLWAIEQGHTEKDNICIYGASYGGYAALMGAAQEPDLYQCTVGYVGLYDIELWGKADTIGSESGRRFVDEAWNYHDESFIKERSPLYHANKIKAEVMLVHGGKDPRVPVKNYHKMSDALNEAGIDHETLLKPYEGHGFYDLDNQIELYDKMLAFFNKNLRH